MAAGRPAQLWAGAPAQSSGLKTVSHYNKKLTEDRGFCMRDIKRPSCFFLRKEIEDRLGQASQGAAARWPWRPRGRGLFTLG